MPRTALTKTTAPGSYPTAGVALTWDAADAVNKNSFVMSGNDLLLARNAHVSDPKTFTVNSAADEMGRTKDVTAQSLAAGDVVVLGPFTSKTGWSQSGGVLHCEGETSDIKFAVLTL